MLRNNLSGCRYGNEIVHAGLNHRAECPLPISSAAVPSTPVAPALLAPTPLTPTPPGPPVPPRHKSQFTLSTDPAHKAHPVLAGESFWRSVCFCRHRDQGCCFTKKKLERRDRRVRQHKTRRRKEEEKEGERKEKEGSDDEKVEQLAHWRRKVSSPRLSIGFVLASSGTEC